MSSSGMILSSALVPPLRRRGAVSAVLVALLGGLCFQLGVMVGMDVGQRRTGEGTVSLMMISNDQGRPDERKRRRRRAVAATTQLHQQPQEPQQRGRHGQEQKGDSGGAVSSTAATSSGAAAATATTTDGNHLLAFSSTAAVSIKPLRGDDPSETMRPQACVCECDGTDMRPAAAAATSLRHGAVAVETRLSATMEHEPELEPPQDRPPAKGSSTRDADEDADANEGAPPPPPSSRDEEDEDEDVLDNDDDGLRLLRETGSNLVVGASHVKRNDFFAAALPESGVPIDPSDWRKDDVLILYTSEASLPNNPRNSSNSSSSNSATSSSSSSAAARAVENCVTMKVVFTELDVESNCIAVVGYPEEAYHVHRYHRVEAVLDGDGNPDGSGKVDVVPDAPLRHVPRNVETRGGFQAPFLPNRADTDKHMRELVRYVGDLPKALAALKPVARKAAFSSPDGNTVIAMAVNHGQSELLANFVCSARARNLDVSQVVVFATDAATVKLASALGVKVFDARTAFGSIPAEAAGNYGDDVFGKIVVAKIYCVHLLVWLGHNVLLQDVDVVWMRHPLEYFTTLRTRGKDLIFQDDGSRHSRFAPYYANTGFYFVSSNDKTAFFFSSLIRMGDVLGKLLCDQETITVFLNEHASWRGLNVEVLPRETVNGTLFPNGYHYLNEKGYMTELLRGELEPYVFHMNWTPNKDVKLKFLSQLGEWRVQPSCLNATALSSGRANLTVGEASALACCTVAPLLECHYRDLPSRVDCRDSPPYEGENPPFWPEPLSNATDTA